MVSSATDDARQLSSRRCLRRRKRRVAEQVDHAQHAVHRRADLVAHHRQETAFRRRRGLRVLDGLRELLLHAPLLGEVDRDADDADRAPARIEHRFLARAHVAQFAADAHALVERARLAGREQGSVLRDEPIVQALAEQLAIVATEDGVHVALEGGRERTVHAAIAQRGVLEEQDVGHGVEDGLQRAFVRVVAAAAAAGRRSTARRARPCRGS